MSKNPCRARVVLNECSRRLTLTWILGFVKMQVFGLRDLFGLARVGCAEREPGEGPLSTAIGRCGPELALPVAPRPLVYTSAQFMDRQTVPIMKACDLAGVSRRTIYNWISSGKVEYIRTAGGSIRIYLDTLFRNEDGTKLSRPFTVAVLFIMLLASPAHAQSTATANTASNVLVGTAIAADAVHSLRGPHRWQALGCQAVRLTATIGAAELLKRIIHKERPDGSDFKSFPSMHTGVAFASMGWRWQVGLPLAIGTGSMRIAARKHDFVDVLAGASIGYLSPLVPCGDEP
jgi:excisionase family DNA binding protein